MSPAPDRHARRRLLVVVLLAGWAGAAALAALVVAPAAFDVLPSRAFAGALVGRVLRALFVSGMVVSALALAVEWLARAHRLAPVRLAAPLAMLVACAAAQFLLVPRIAAVRAAIGQSLDLADPADPRRVAFGRLHALSVGYLAMAMLAAVVTIWLTAGRRSGPEAPA